MRASICKYTDVPTWIVIISSWIYILSRINVLAEMWMMTKYFLLFLLFCRLLMISLRPNKNAPHSSQKIDILFRIISLLMYLHLFVLYASVIINNDKSNMFSLSHLSSSSLSQRILVANFRLWMFTLVLLNMLIFRLFYLPVLKVIV